MEKTSWLKRINWQNAIGEIIIVIIGIMIAFTLNNYGEGIKNRQTKRMYLESINDDLGNEAKNLASNIEAYSKKLEMVNQIRPYLQGKMDGRDTILFKVFRLAQTFEYYPYDVTYKTLVNSGDLGLFNDFILKRRIQEHYSEQEQIRDAYLREEAILKKYFADFLIYEVDYQKIGSQNFDLLDDKTLNNIVQSLFGTFNIIVSSSKNGIERCKASQNMIQEYLEKL